MELFDIEGKDLLILLKTHIWYVGIFIVKRMKGPFLQYIQQPHVPTE